ncbi:MAG: MFS transporter [bacterium]|nr:MFS transporter [bacterium]
MRFPSFAVPAHVVTRRLRRMGWLLLIMVVIEFLDEFAYGTREAAWPLIRQDLNLSYEQIGILLAVPGLIAAFIEPFFGVWSNMGYRKLIMILSGIVFGGMMMLAGLSSTFWMFLIFTTFEAPGSGGMVGLAQTALMDSDPERHEQNMARWTLAGSVGNLIAPLLLGVSVAIGVSWRGQYLFIGLLIVIAALVLTRVRIPAVNSDQDEEDDPRQFFTHFADAFKALRQPGVTRSLVLLQFSDFMLDVLFGYLALYFVDVVGTDAALGGLAVTVWTGVGLFGDILIIPLLERMRGTTYLRISAAATLILFPAFLLVPDVTAKLVLLGAMGFMNAGWYSILQAQVYTALPGQSGTALVLGTIFYAVGGLSPFMIGLVAGQAGLGAAMWIMLLGPIALLVGLPRRRAV